MAPFPAQIGIVRHPPKMARLTDAAGPDGPWFGRLCVIERLLAPEPVSRATVSLIAGLASTDTGRCPSHLLV